MYLVSEFSQKKILQEELLRQRNGRNLEETTDRQGEPTLEELPEDILSLTLQEVIRRLRLLKEPIILFGETEEERYRRLYEAEKSLEVADEAAGGQQENLHTALQRLEKEKAKMIPLDLKPPEQLEEAQDVEEKELLASFKEAADQLAEKTMPAEEVIEKRIRRWMKDWEEDLDRRSQEDKRTAAGKQADVRFRETQEYLRPLYYRLRNQALEPQLLAGIKLMVDAMKDRNYLHAYKIYMGVAIGNSPWPIGVTQVGLHERASREKISFKYASGSAHIMNDEATRKLIQALKRIMTFCQRRYPTDPSRSADFDGGSSLGDGSTDKVALLQAEFRGDEIRKGPTPTLFDRHGAKVPEKWDAIIKEEFQKITSRNHE